jgi:hypothetical protein
MNWNYAEHDEMKSTIASIYSGSHLRSNQPTWRSIDIRLDQAAVFRIGLADFNGGSLFVRHLLTALGSDLSRLFKLGIEHKLMQALLLNVFKPGCVLLQQRREDF